MSNNLIRRLIVLGGLAILGIVSLQSYWTYKTYDIKEEQFHVSVMRALRNVAGNISTLYKTELPKQDLIQRRSSNYYAVNVNSPIDASVLEDYLYAEFNKGTIINDFEYAVYDCTNDELVYGQYCNLNKEDDLETGVVSLPKFDGLVYYFVVHFPSKASFLIGNMWQTILFNIMALLACLFFIYTIWVILKQKRLSELQKDFINNMTHEFKTPISSIKIAADVFAKDAHVKSDQRLSHYAEILQQQNSRLNDQVEKVLNIARAEKDGFEINKVDFDLNDVIEDTIAAENAKIQNHNVELEIDLASLDLPISGDRLHLTNVIANIMDNAIKYCKEQAFIKISTRRLTNGLVILSVRDEGIGMQEEETKKVKDKFYRVSTGNLHKVKGFGLGLYYVNQICKAHGWGLDISSAPNEFTEVKITFNR